MLSSIILSMAISMTPGQQVETQELNINEINAKRGTRRLSSENNLKVDVINAKRGTRRLSSENTLEVEAINAKRGTRRL